MQYDSIGTKIKILIISLFILSFVIIFFIFYEESPSGFNKYFSCILLSVHLFFFPPMIKYMINWFKTMSMQEAVYAGFRIGYYGIGFLCLLAPVVGIMYYINKRFKKNGRSGRNIIIVGWYID